MLLLPLYQAPGDLGPSFGFFSEFFAAVVWPFEGFVVLLPHLLLLILWQATAALCISIRASSDSLVWV